MANPLVNVRGTYIDPFAVTSVMFCSGYVYASFPGGSIIVPCEKEHREATVEALAAEINRHRKEASSPQKE